MDLILRQGKLPGEDQLVDVAIKDGRFYKIASHIKEQGNAEIQVEGKLISPPFVESHVHLDSALTAGNPRFNQSGTLLEAIDIWNDYKKDLTKEQVKAYAKKAIHWLMAQGVLRIRTHTDITEKNLHTLSAMLELKEEMKEYVDLQIVAFPQNGIIADEKMLAQFERSLQEGADAVGGLPQAEYTREDGIRQIEHIFNLAKKHNKLIDIHTDETGDSLSRFAEVIAKYTDLYNMHGQVTASHTAAMHNYQNDYAMKLIGHLKTARVNIVTNPFSNSLLQNRLDGYPRYRGITRIDALLEQRVNVSIGNDNIMDPFNPLGKGSLLQAANLLVHTAHLSRQDQIKELFQMITTNGAKTLQDHNYGIEVGKQADCIVIDAQDEQEAIRLMSDCLYVVRKGKIIAKTKPSEHHLYIEDPIVSVDFKSSID